MKRDDVADFGARANVSRETLDALSTYAHLLEEWNKAINLVSPATIGTLWTRHFLDSAQLMGLAETSGKWVDLGSGGGFPGLVVAIMSQENREVEIVLVEADQRKATFLRTVIRKLGLHATVIAERIEKTNPLAADVVSARALAPLDALLGFAERHMKPAGTALFLKGAKVDAEITDALERWSFDCDKHPSLTETNSTVLRIGDIKRV